MSREQAQRVLEADVLRWIASLPLLREADVEQLTGADESDVRRALEALRRCGWVERVQVRSPEFAEDAARYLLRDVAVPYFIEAFGLDEDEARSWPIGRSENLGQVTRVEIADGVNRLLASLVDHYDREAWVDSIDLRAVPLARRDAESWWPRDVEAYGCLRAGNRFAHFFVAWDRREAPAVHRRARVRAWYDAAESADRWDEGRLPAILLACPARRLERDWLDAVEHVAERRDRDELEVLVIEQRQVRGDVTGPVWHPLGEDAAITPGRWLA